MSRPHYEEGLHVGKITDQAIGKSSTNKPQVVIRVKILGVPDSETTHVAHRQQLERTIYMTVTDKTVGFITENLATAGFDGEKLSQFDPSHPNHVSIVGNQVYLWCKYEQQQDQDGKVSDELRERWQISKGTTKLEVKPLAAKEMRELDSLFAKALKQAKPAVKKAETKPNQHGVHASDADLPAEMWQGDDGDPGIDDQDIPF